jgi:carboxyl-terminal processing protease
MRKSRLLVAAVLTTVVAAVALVAAIGTEWGLSPANLALIASSTRLIQRNYLHPVGQDQLVTDALKGMFARLDPHSGYMDEQEFKEIQATINGKFGGLGIEMSDQSGTPQVISPIDGEPAARAGLQPGDQIVSINGQSTRGMDAQKVVGLLRGKPGTAVTLTISRGGKPPFDVTITRSIIQVHTVKSKLEPHNIGYVHISQFSDETPKDLAEAIKQLKQQTDGRLKGFVLDLRDDPGGLLNAALAVAGYFLDGGKVVTIHGRRSEDDVVYLAPAKADLLPNIPMVVLINGASASASEIVAGALQDRHRAMVMGTQSFGKGSVQTIIPLDGRGALRLTTALYYTPAGRSIQHDGVSPDVVIEAPKDQQVTDAGTLRESALHGALENPGPLGTRNAPGAEHTAAGGAASPPIQEQLIGTPEDAQLKAALSHLEGT